MVQRQTGESNRILIIKLSALGDLVMALPHMEIILSHHPSDSVWLMTSPPYRSLFQNHPRLNVAVLDRSRRFGADSMWGRILWARRHRFAAVYDLQGNRSSRRIVRFSGASRRIGTQPRSIYTDHPDEPYTRATAQNVFDRLNDTLAAAGLPRASSGCTLYPSVSDKKAVFAWRQQNNIEDGKFAVAHAGSSRKWVSKRWSREKYVQLAMQMEQAGIRCVWIGDADDREVNQYLGQRIGIDATECFTILQLYWLGKDALFAVTNDSGPMHVLAASGIPVYGFFGPTSWVRSHAMGQRDRAIFCETACSPCFSGTCPPSRHHACLEGIDVDTVFLKIQGHLKLEA